MNPILKKQHFFEVTSILLIYTLLFAIAYITKDSHIALTSAFCGITYTILAGKGNPICYLIGLTGSVFYIYLAYKNQIWGNMLLYALYYLPMQMYGFIDWNKNLKKGKYEIIKTYLGKKEKLISFIITSLFSLIAIYFLWKTGDSNPIADGITTVFSLLGMYYTVKRAIEQWFVWIGVNILTLILWLRILMNGEKVYSTVFMWFTYLILGIYFFIIWKKELQNK